MSLHLYCRKLIVMGKIMFFCFFLSQNTFQCGLCETEMNLILLVSWNICSEDLDIVAIKIQMHSWRFKVLSEKPQESEKSQNNQTGYNAEINGEQDYRPCQIGRKAS